MEILIHYVDQADRVSLITAAILLLMSFSTWSVMLFKYGQNRRQRVTERHFLEQFWNRRDPDRAVDHDPQHALGRLAAAGLDATRYDSQPPGHGDLDGFVTRALRQALDVESAALEYGLTVLATVGSTAPFVGLFGTVWSVHHALLALGSSGQPTIDKVAGPVGEALVMTGAGLAVAIPAVIAYNLFTRANRLRLLELDGFAFNLHAFLLAGKPPKPRPNPNLSTDQVLTAPVALAENG
ncbi:MAG: MotA/TolQ/ExbB proton channel family protein [Candidatus Contendobacter sp.]|mgnify:CR=1 FL=1|jgi:biopolymer transport protein ExbB|nr:MotA/TolQ/ExbB proton channel family protein [Gammaproteobacteria bacterium]MCC8994435.1 MotA/TolQ/ExbB proton channel family protein [Candidatus Contendobacter sp.]